MVVLVVVVDVVVTTLSATVVGTTVVVVEVVDVVVLVVAALATSEGALSTPRPSTTDRTGSTRRRRICQRYLLGMSPNRRSRGDTYSMGFDAQRKQVRRESDIWFVAAAIAVALGLVAWAFLG